MGLFIQLISDMDVQSSADAQTNRNGKRNTKQLVFSLGKLPHSELAIAFCCT